MMPCPFCTPENSRILLANTHALAIPDAYPVTPGHTLIIPRRHIASFFETRPEEQTAMLELLAEARSLLLTPPHPPGISTPVPAGFNIGINDGAAAGQTVPHLHIHLIPRYAGDTADPRGGVRWIMPRMAPYWKR